MVSLRAIAVYRRSNLTRGLNGHPLIELRREL
jgi:hypothetical protein